MDVMIGRSGSGFGFGFREHHASYCAEQYSPYLIAFNFPLSRFHTMAEYVQLVKDLVLEQDPEDRRYIQLQQYPAHSSQQSNAAATRPFVSSKTASTIFSFRHRDPSTEPAMHSLRSYTSLMKRSTRYPFTPSVRNGFDST